MEKLIDIQSKLKAPKGQYSDFGGYHYRSCEDILEAIKPLLGKATLTISDEIVQIGDRYYVKATVTLNSYEEKVGLGAISVTAYARETETRPKMDAAQLTGAASSYARKYALNGLFCIDDTKDADSMDNSQKVDKNGTTSPNKGTVNSIAEPEITAEVKADAQRVMALFEACKTPEELLENAKNYQDQIKKWHSVIKEDVRNVYDQTKARLEKGKKQ